MFRLARNLTARPQRFFHGSPFIAGATNEGASSQSLVHELNDTNFKTFLANSKVPVIADFYADWCGPCRMITPVLTRAVQQENGKVLLAKINVDQCGSTAGAYGITALPTVIAFKNGKEIGRFIGMKDEKQIKTFVTNALQQ